MKTGYKTTEFWLTLVAVVAGAIASSGLFATTSVVVKVAALISTVLGALGYAYFRTGTKTKDSEVLVARAQLAKALSVKSKVPQPHRED